MAFVCVVWFHFVCLFGFCLVLGFFDCFVYINVLGSVVLLSAAEVLACPREDEQSFMKVVQTLNTDDLCQHLPFKNAPSLD